jgi:ubiquinone/menaquinone biosynthesis C-methylase UbiE
MSENGPSDNDRAHQVWDGLAEYWDEQVGADGNSFHRTFVGPNVDRLLEVAAGDRILDIACGTGTFLRRLVALGAEVVGADFSENMLAQARRRAADAGAPQMRAATSTCASSTRPTRHNCSHWARARSTRSSATTR